jgi:glutamyl-Q tRNA(Asp) synthetase
MSRDAQVYVGRFAPSPTGPLHAGSLATALASRLDALAHGGRWLLRIEDLDPPREQPGATEHILGTLAALGFRSDGEILFQSRRHADYEAAFARLVEAGHVYPCACTRREIADSLSRRGLVHERHGERVYPGTCRAGLPPGRAPRAWRVAVDRTPIRWSDRALPTPREDRLDESVGDFVLRRADGLWAYQLAVVVDDGAQAVTDVVRGDDLLEATPRQAWLQSLLGLPRPRWLHLPVITDARGEKLSKQTGAPAVDAREGVRALEAALAHLGLPPTGAATLELFWPRATASWARRWLAGGNPGSPRPAG